MICDNCGKKFVRNQKEIHIKQIKELLKQDLNAKEISFRLGIGISCTYRYLEYLGAKKVYKLPDPN